MKVQQVMFIFLINLTIFQIAFADNSTQATGFYSRGHLINGESILNRSGFVQKLFITRGRNYSTQETLDVIQNVSSSMKFLFPKIEKLQVGDLSALGGGKVSRHKSHQNGLDADIVYYRNNGYVQSSASPEWEEEFVISGKVSKNFNVERNWALLKEIIKTAKVNRIFVDPMIKIILCDYNKKNGTLEKNVNILRRLRPLHLHSTHFHLRLMCPRQDRACINQGQPPKGSGCL